MWGQVPLLLSDLLSLGIIPMRVGTSCRIAVRDAELRDHPHACGDKTKEIKENSGFAKSTA